MPIHPTAIPRSARDIVFCSGMVHAARVIPRQQAPQNQFPAPISWHCQFDHRIPGQSSTLACSSTFRDTVHTQLLAAIPHDKLSVGGNF